MSPKRSFLITSPFDKTTAKFVIDKFKEGKSVAKVMRAFRVKFFPGNPKKVPSRKSFARLIQRFETEAAVRPGSPTGTPPVSDEDITMVRDCFTLNQEAHIRQAVADIGFSYGKIWSILRKNLQWKAYHPHKVQILSEANKLSRVAACRFFLSFPDDWFQNQVIWSDEKWFVLIQRSNRKNYCTWAPSSWTSARSRVGRRSWPGLVWLTGGSSQFTGLKDLLMGKSTWTCLRTASGHPSGPELLGRTTGCSRTVPPPISPGL